MIRESKTVMAKKGDEDTYLYSHKRKFWMNNHMFLKISIFFTFILQDVITLIRLVNLLITLADMIILLIPITSIHAIFTQSFIIQLSGAILPYLSYNCCHSRLILMCYYGWAFLDNYISFAYITIAIYLAYQELCPNSFIPQVFLLGWLPLRNDISNQSNSKIYD